MRTICSSVPKPMPLVAPAKTHTSPFCRLDAIKWELASAMEDGFIVLEVDSLERGVWVDVRARKCFKIVVTGGEGYFA